MTKFKINIDENKIKSLNATCVLDKYLSEEQLEQLRYDRAVAFDKWVWLTGTEEDHEEFKRLDAAVKDAELNVEVSRICEAIIEEAAKEMAKEVDEMIIKNLSGDADAEG